MNRQASSKANTRSRSTDEDGIGLSFSEANARSKTTVEDGVDLWMGDRVVPGIGTVTIFARLEMDAHKVIIEQRDRERSTFTILHTADEVQRLVRFLIMVQEHLPLKQSA